MANVIDPRIALLNSIADTVPPDYYRADGTELRFYAYAWFHGQTCINVGKGTGPRFLEFFVNPDYNTLAAHDYVRQHHGELEVFFCERGYHGNSGVRSRISTDRIFQAAK
jgi:hypothetical protein